MKFALKAVTVSLILAAGIASAADEATNPIVIAQKDLMHVNAGAAKTLGGMASGEVAFDAAAAAAAKAALIDASAKIATVFETAGADPASKASPDIWTNWEDFVAKANGLNAAATALDVASVDGVKAGMGAIGGACKACHTSYRMQ